MAGVEVRAARRRYLFSGVLADQPGCDPQGNRVHSISARHQRARLVGRGLAVAGVGLCTGRRIWADAFRAVALYKFFGVSEVSDSGFERDRGILGDGLAEYS